MILPINHTHNCSLFVDGRRKGSEDEGLEDPAEGDLDLDDEPPGSPLVFEGFIGIMGIYKWDIVFFWMICFFGGICWDIYKWYIEMGHICYWDNIYGIIRDC